MPRNDPMNYQREHFRWRKHISGKNHIVTCEELGLPEEDWTEDRSRAAMREWAEKNLPKKATRTNTKPPTSIEIVADATKGFSLDSLARQIEQLEHLKKIHAVAERLGMGTPEQLGNGSVAANLDLSSGLAAIQAGEITPADLDEILASARGVRQLNPETRESRAKKLAATLAPVEVVTNRTVAHFRKEFMADRETQVRLGDMEPKTYEELESGLKWISTLKDDAGLILPETADVSSIVSAVVKRMNNAIKVCGLKTKDAKKKRWGFFKRLVKSLAENGIIPMPINIDSNDFKFGKKGKNETKAVKKFDTKRVVEFVKKLPSRLRLYAMLGLNCGMTQVDMAEMTKDMVVDGILTRKRVKTEAIEGVPTVSYRLWPETLKLLAEHESDHPTLYLTSSEGTQLVTKVLENGKVKEKDLCELAYKRHFSVKDKATGKKKSLKPEITLKNFRSISSTLIESHEFYGRYGEFFLGHSPKSIKYKHYAAPSDELFDKIMAWLYGEIFGGK